MNIKLDLFKKNIMGKRIAVLGIGVSNTPLIRFLAENGAIVTACDKKMREELGKVIYELEEMGVNFRLGEGYLDNLDHEIIFKTPGMRYDLPQLEEAKKRGSIVTSEMEVFFDLCPAQIIAVTGSDGKTTTTSLIYEILKVEGYVCHLGGNIGKPLLSEIESIHSEHKVVLELSSFQLQTMKSSPDIAVITNITPNHLDIHKSMEEYIEAKKNIFRYQSESGRLVLNYNNEITRSFANEAVGKVIFFSGTEILPGGVYEDGGAIYYKNEHILNTSGILLPGRHNIENFLAAIGAVADMVKPASIDKVAKTFSGVEHRIEFVTEKNGIKFYNDSIASSPTRTRAALYSFDQKLVLIAGGYDKKIPFDTFGQDVIKRVKKLVLTGDTAPKIKDAVIKAATGGASPPIYECPTFEEAVRKAFEVAEKGDIVILSPACASFDMFKNFAERGNRFKELVREL